TREHSIKVHQCSIHVISFKRYVLQAFIEIWKSAMEEMGIPAVLIDTRLNKENRECPIKEYTVFTCNLPENGMRMKICHTNSKYIRYLCTYHHFQKPSQCG
ncbi:unnamed protein product, partial [Gulo gulo]